MAKDGTNRGGRRVRAGDKPAPAAEKKQKGLPVKIISNDIPALDTAELEAVDLPEGAMLNGSDMPKPSDYLSARQKNGVPLGADDIYRETWLWLKQRSCENLVSKIHSVRGGNQHLWLARQAPDHWRRYCFAVRADVAAVSEERKSHLV